MTEPRRIPTPPPLPPPPSRDDALQELLADEEDEYRVSLGMLAQGMAEPFLIPAPPPLPPPPLPPPLLRDAALQELLDSIDDEDENKKRRFQKNLQFRMVGAIEKENTQLLHELIEDGVNTNATILLVKTPLTHALDGLTHDNGILGLLLGSSTETDPDLGENTPWGLKPLHIIAKNGIVSIAKLFLESPRGSQGDINVRDNGGATPLHFAIFHCHDDMAQYLINQGADVCAVDNVGRSTLHRACETHNFKIAELLLDNGICVDVADKYGWTPLFQCVFFRHVSMVRFLIDRGASVEKKDLFGESLIQIACYLQWAVERGKHYPVKVSIGSSFNFYERTKGIPPESLKELLYNLDDRIYDISDFTEHFNMLKLLVNTGADPNSHPSDGHAQTGIFDALARTRAYLILAGSILDPSDPWATADTHWQGWFSGQVAEQFSLKRQCRRRVRTLLRQTRNINSAVDVLPLPNALKLYLQLNDYELLENSLIMNET